MAARSETRSDPGSSTQPATPTRYEQISALIEHHHQEAGNKEDTKTDYGSSLKSSPPRPVHDPQCVDDDDDDIDDDGNKNDDGNDNETRGEDTDSLPDIDHDFKSPSDPVTQKRCSPSSSSSSARLCPGPNDIQPTWPKPRDLDFAKIYAVAAWDNERLTNLKFDLHWRPDEDLALFKLHAPISVHRPGTTKGSKAKARTSVYIYPERILALQFDLDPHEKPFDEHTISLTWELKEPPVIVVPNNNVEFEHLVPLKEQLVGVTQDHRAAAFDTLASKTKFTVFAKMNPRTVPSAQLRFLCNAFQADHQAQGQELRTLTAFTDLSSLFWGLGAKIVEGRSLAPSQDLLEDLQDDPPQYSDRDENKQLDSAPGAKLAPSGRRGTKRPRSASDSVASSPEGGVDSQKSVAPSSNSPALSVDPTIQTLLLQMESRLRSHVDKSIEALRKEVFDELGEIRGEMTKGFELETEARELDIQNVEDDVMARITSQGVSINFDETLRGSLTFTGHPDY